MPLGFDAELFLNNPVERETRQAMLTGIQQLGQQVQQGIRSIATNRDLRSMGDELRNVNPQSNDFAFRMVDIISNHPLAVTDPRGIAVINILGNAHKEHQALKLRVASQRPLGQRTVKDELGRIRTFNPNTGVLGAPEELPEPDLQGTPSGSITSPLTPEQQAHHDYLLRTGGPKAAADYDESVLKGIATTGQVIARRKPEETGLSELTALRNKLELNKKYILRPYEDALKEAQTLDKKANDAAYSGKTPQDQRDPSTSAGQLRRAAEAAAQKANAIQNDPMFQSQLQATDSALMEIIRAQQGSAAPASIPSTGSFTFGAGVVPSSPVQTAPQIMRWTRDASGRSIPVR